MTEDEQQQTQTQTRLKLLELAHDMSMMGFSVDKLIESTQKLMRFVHSSNTMHPNQAPAKDVPHEAVQQQRHNAQTQFDLFGTANDPRLYGLNSKSKAYSDTPSSSAP